MLCSLCVGGMAAEQPTTLWCRFGIRTYQLSDQDLLHPGELVDRLVQIKDVCRAGAFVVSIHTLSFNTAVHFASNSTSCINKHHLL